MKIKELINQESKINLVLIHGGNSTYNEWDEYVKYFETIYNLYLVSISGHGDAFDEEYSSINQNAMEIINYFKEKKNSNIFLFGRGLGGQIALSIIEQEPNLVSKVILESVSCVSLSYLKYPLYFSMCHNYKEDKDAIEQKLRMPKYKFKKMIKDNTNFVLDVRINAFKGEALILYSENDDKFFQKSAVLLKSNVQNSTIKSYNLCHLFGLVHFCDIIKDINEFLKN